ncbi:MAG: alpha/beta hydrolase [Actinomycetota bacterium]|nr:alpha/beta hydrolase [Actinomycetota bacterium]
MAPRHIVFLHGQPGSGSDWRPVVDRMPSGLIALVLDRPGYGSNPQPAGDFDFNARAALAELDALGIDRAVLVGHSYGGGVALAAAHLAPERVEALVLVASVGPGCINGWDRLLAAPVAGPVCALAAWSLTPRFARARLARIERLRRRPLEPDELVNWYVWGHSGHDHGPLWRTFLTEQRALVNGLGHLVSCLPAIRTPTLVLADPVDTLIPIATAHGLCEALPDARLELVQGAGHHLPRRASREVAAAIAHFLAPLDAPPG